MIERDIPIGPVFMSDEEILRINTAQADARKGHRLMACFPLAAVLFFIWAYFSGNIGPIQFWVTSTPLIVVGFGCLTLRPYRPVRSIEVSGVMNEIGLTINVRGVSWLAQKHTLKWSDVVGFERVDSAFVFYQRSGEQWRMPAECIPASHQRVALTRFLEDALGRQLSVD